ncbi:MAG: diphthamide biosynthesis enzyme Dph2 [Candidatus Bathyarchaeota archaeon]
MIYDFENKRVINSILESSAKRVLLQLPDGLKNYGVKIAKILEDKTKATIYLSADPCYGSCDLPIDEAKMLNIDLVVHYGHSVFKKENFQNMIYVDVKVKIQFKETVKKSIPLLKGYKRIGLITAIQHVDTLEGASKLLSDLGKEVKIGRKGSHVKYDGQVTGCDYASAKNIENEVDAFLFIGGGIFHALGVFLATEKPVVVADPYLNMAKDVTNLGEKIIKQRRAALAKTIQAKRLGIITGVKKGQLNLKVAEMLKEKLEKDGKETFLLCLKEITPEALDNFQEIDAFINTACPRIGVDDRERYRRPIIATEDALTLLRNG